MILLEKMTNPWKESTAQTILINYTKADTYNTDEFGLFYQTLKNPSFWIREMYRQKIRLTDIAAANMNGDKLPMFVIAKSNKLGA